MSKLIDPTGQIFSRLTVLSRAENDKRGNAHWNCQCECGKLVVTLGSDLRRKITRSCGCLQKELISELNKELNRERFTTHGLSNHPLCHRWWDMNNRCNNPNEDAYKDYGGRGIAVCDRWHRDNPDGLKNFIEDMESSYKTGLTLDRINNNLGYYKENCRWTTMKVQNSNKRSNRINECLK